MIINKISDSIVFNTLKKIKHGFLEIINFTEQKCDVAYEEDDFQFIQELIVANKIDTNSISAVNEIYDNVHWTTTENKNEFNQFVLRIKKLEWNNQNISIIPDQIGFLDSLSWLELENNKIDNILDSRMHRLACSLLFIKKNWESIFSSTHPTSEGGNHLLQKFLSGYKKGLLYPTLGKRFKVVIKR